MSKSGPSTNGSNGRDPAGRFAKGNRGGPGNPLAARVQRIRAQLIEALTPVAVRKIVTGLIRQASAGDVAATKVLLQWSLGEPIALDALARLDALEEQLRSYDREAAKPN